LGAAAEKWRDKILHPKSRIEKLGIKPEGAVSVLGSFDPEFLEELKRLAGTLIKDKVAADSDAVFFAADSVRTLSRVAKIAKSLKGATALWIVYPKGQKTITESNVIAAGRKTGLKDVKVVGFSPTHTALKFLIPHAGR
jgi:hypothetical protein